MDQRFRVRHLPPGRAAVHEEILAAASAVLVRARLEQRGSIVLDVREASVPRLAWQGASTREGRFDVAWWCRELETLLRAGMNPVEAIETLAADRRGQPDARAQVHGRLVRELQQGAALSEAMRRSDAFPEILIAGVAASERTSTLAAALTDYLRYDELLDRLRRQAASAALYPALVVSLGLVIGAFLLLFVIPRFSRMYETFSGPVSASTQWVLALSSVVREHGWLIGAALVVGVGVVVLAWVGGGLRAGVVRMLNSMPLLRRPTEHFRLAQMYQAMGMLVRGGYTVDESLAVVSRVALGPSLLVRMNQVRDAVARGKSVSGALAGAALADVVDERLLSVGERGGDFARILLTVAERHAREFATFVERATRLLEPLLLLIVALVVGGLVVMMYMPIFDIAGGVGN